MWPPLLVLAFRSDIMFLLPSRGRLAVSVRWGAGGGGGGGGGGAPTRVRWGVRWFNRWSFLPSRTKKQSWIIRSERKRIVKYSDAAS